MTSMGIKRTNGAAQGVLKDTRSRIAKGVAIALFSFAHMTLANASPEIEALQPVTVGVVPEHVFVPSGFDDNDNVQVVLDGQLDDTCHKLGPTIVTVSHETRRITIRQTAFFYPGAWCADVRVPYAMAVDLGILHAGKYEVVAEKDGDSAKTMDSIPVAISTSSGPDERLYAPVSETRLIRPTVRPLSEEEPQSQQRSPYQLQLSGTFPSLCMHMGEVKVLVRPNHVIEVLPFAEIEHERSCAAVQSDFSSTINLGHLSHGRYLIHVRSLNGQSINKITDL